jgi:hypothetical protein
MTEPPRMDRRQAIKWMLAASATVSTLHLRSFGATPPAASGYGTDPNLLESYKPGDLWPLTLTKPQRRATTALCDVMLPADDRSPAASTLRVPDFIDEWISAPYPEQRADRREILDGLDWLDRESRRRFDKDFADLNGKQQRRICDDIAYEPSAGAKFKSAARFFTRFRNLAAGGFYTTPQGWKDIQYLGNVPLTRFDGPPPEVLAFLKLT